MTTTHGRILAGSSVNISGRYQIGHGSSASAPTVSNAKGPPQPAHAAIIQTNPNSAVIEVKCTCGQKMHVKCQYTPAAHAENAPDENINKQENINGESENAEQ